MSNLTWKATRSVGVENLTAELNNMDKQGWDVDRVVPDTTGGFVVLFTKPAVAPKGKK